MRSRCRPALLTVIAGAVLLDFVSLASAARSQTTVPAEERASLAPPLPPPRPSTSEENAPRPILFLGDAADQRITTGPEADLSQVAGLELARHAREGRLRIGVRAGTPSLELELEGTGISDTTEACVVRVSAHDGVPAAPQGRTFGPLSFRLEAPACPLLFDVLDAAVMVHEPIACEFEAADCRVSPRGLWSPGLSRIAALEGRSAGLRAIAERAIADNERALARRGVDRVPTRPFALDSCGAFDEGIAREFCEARLLAARSMRLALLLGLYPGEGAAAPVDRMPAPPLRIIPTDGALPLGERSE